MRIGIDIRPLQSTSRERGIGYYLRGLLEGLARNPTGEEQEYVLLTIAERDVPDGIGNGLKASFLPLPLEPRGWRMVAPVRYLRWLNPVHARQRGMRYDMMLRRRWDMQRLASAAQQARLDVLHLPSVFEPEYSANVGPQFPCPVVQTVHDLIPEVFPEMNRHAGWPFWYMRAMGLQSLADGRGTVVAISESACVDTERFVPKTHGRMTVVHNGVGQNFAPVERAAVSALAAKYRLSPERFFLTNGGTEWRKNLETVLHAAAIFAKTKPGYKIVIPGRLSETDRLQVSEWARKVDLAEDGIFCTGFVPDAEMPALYTGAAALAFPSRYEGFGLPVVEAMRCGCPVITARNSSLPEAAGNCAVFVEDADDAQALADAMQVVTGQPEFADDLCARGLVWSQQFSWDTAAASYLDLYARLCQEERREDRIANRL